jgi:hypothetical protein
MSTTQDDGPENPLELKDMLCVETKDGATLLFEVVGILEDPDDHVSYAVLFREHEDEAEEQFIVTDLQGKLLEDDEWAQEILDDFRVFAEEAGDAAGPTN